jgi:hypothetical protein
MEEIMKIGIMFTGESYGKNQGVFNANNRNWAATKENIKTNLIDAFGENHEVKTYITTYDQPFLDHLIEFYKPEKSLIVDINGSHQRTTYIRSMQSLLDEDLDFIIATRFDLEYPEPVTNFKFDFDKMNFACREIEPHWTNDRFVNDCLYAFPKKYLQAFITSIEKEHATPYRWHPDMHGIYRFFVEMVKEEDINFLIDGCFSSSNVPQLYKLVRA